jgi:hypothetical protein
MLVGFALMGASLVALDRVTTLAQATPLIALASAAWTLPMANAYPLFIEPVPPRRRGILAALFLLCVALGGAIGDPLNGSLFGLYGWPLASCCSSRGERARPIRPLPEQWRQCCLRSGAVAEFRSSRPARMHRYRRTPRCRSSRLFRKDST